jgi:hypothetical protein
MRCMPDRPCPGCLDSRVCWVCLGTGNADTARHLGICSSCGGTARCAYCDRALPPRVVALDNLVRPIDVRDLDLRADEPDATSAGSEEGTVDITEIRLREE